MSKKADDAVDRLLSKGSGSSGRSSIHGLVGEPLAIRRTSELIAFMDRHGRVPKRTVKEEASLARFLASLRQSYKGGSSTRVFYPRCKDMLESKGYLQVLAVNWSVGDE